MRRASFLSNSGRGACVVLAAASISLAVAGCSSGSSRFDFPSLNLTGGDSSSNADLATTSALPVPEELVYSPGSGADPRFQRTALPPPSYSPRPSDAYSPAPNKAARSGPGRVPGHRITVAKGDTLSSLSRRYGVPVEAIVSANDLPDGRLAAGQLLVMPGVSGAKVAASEAGPAAATYKVQKGDTPHSIAAKLGVDEAALIERNDLKPSRLKIGQVLAIPRNDSDETVVAEDPEITGPKSSPKVRKVKTTTISAAEGTSLAEEESETYAEEGGVKQAAKAGTKRPNPASDLAASPETAGEGEPRVAGVDRLPAPDPMSGNSFRWPVKGRVVAEFGARPDGGHNDGIDVAVPQGTSVKAAENGVVAYAGNELKGYGNLVLIRHANNWVSAYANNAELLVKRGDKVRRGQIIAKAGATGAVSQPQVHFELRKGSRPVDPTKYMSDHAANAE